MKKENNELLQQSGELTTADFETVYQKLVRGLTVFPPFVIQPTDEEYEVSENLLQMDEDEFNRICKA